MANALLLPVFVQVTLTFVLLFMLVAARAKANRADPTLLKRAAIDTSVYPEAAQKISKCVDNQMQTPVLFYAVVAFAILTANEGSLLLIIFAWIFVLSRIIHAFIQTGANAVLPRFLVFLIGVLALMSMWGLLAFQIYSPV